MPAANPTISTFAGVAPPWSLANLDANFVAVANIVNSINTYEQYAADTGSANVYVIAFAAGTSITLSAGLGVTFKATNANTGASTLNAGGTGAKNIFNPNGTALTNGQIPAGSIVHVVYDGTQYLMQSCYPMTSVTNSLSGDVALNNTGLFFVGPTVAQGTVGTWLASGGITLTDTAGVAQFIVKLWDGTTVIDSTLVISSAANRPVRVSLSGTLTSPAGNIRFSAQDSSSTNGAMLFNASGSSKDCTLTAVRIG